LRAEGRKRKTIKQAVCKNQLNLNANTLFMKAFLHVLFIFVVSNAYTQERKSEKASLHIDFKKTEQRKLWVQEYTNAKTAFYGAQNETTPVTMRLAAQKIPLKSINPFLSYFITWEETNNDKQNSKVKIRFSHDNQSWSEWETMKPDEHVNETPGRFIGQLQFKGKEFNYYQVEISTNRSAKGKLISNLYINFFSPGEMQQTGGRISNPSTTSTRSLACTLPQPAFVNRAAWGTAQTWSPSTTTVTHLIVHHAAGTNTSSDWGAVVLGIWNFHTTPSGSGGAGYSDIGYNWLVAPNGVLYEGRYKSSISNIQGAHFCGTNGNTMGVCMLGDYTNITITPAARNTLAQVLAWKACERNIDPLQTSFHANSGLTINNISGHRDGCATQCPGNTFYPDLPGVRIDVSNIINGATPVTTIIGLEEFSINPNPVKNTAVLNLKLNIVKEIQYRIVSVDGKIIYQSIKQKLSGVWREELKALNELPPATYLLQLWLNDEMVSRKLIKQ
jgi:N-acetylmuramoyl-L-alanine amidase